MIVCLLHFGSNHSYVLMFSPLRVFDDPKESTKESVSSDRLAAAEAVIDQAKQFDDSDLKWEMRQSVIALVSFSLGLLTLIVFATKNLPWPS